MHSLPIFLRLSGQPVILVGKGEAAEAKRRLLTRAGARIVAEKDEARLAIVAVEDDAEAQAAVGRLRARGILVNATDRPALCDFTLPAIVDRNPVLIAIGTGGASAGLAKALRIALEAWLPARLGALATSLAAARSRIVSRWPDPAQRRHAIDHALMPGGSLDLLVPGSIDQWLSDPGDAASVDLITIVLRSADPDDLTLREARLLGRADRIYHEANVPPSILDRARADAVRIVHDRKQPPTASGLSLWLKWSG